MFLASAKSTMNLAIRDYPCPTLDMIQDVVADHYGLTALDLVSDRRGRSEARPRMLVMWLAKHCTPHSLPAIGKMFGGRDHSTVMHAIKRIDHLMQGDDDLATTAQTMRAYFQEAWTTRSLVA